MKILITGNTGTIGTALVEKLIEEHEVIGIDKKELLFSHDNDNFKQVYLNLLDDDCFKDLNEKDFDACIHLAANPLVRKSVENPSLAFENVIMTSKVLEFCRINNIKNVMVASSREIYGNQFKVKKCEDDVNINGCESPYAASKFYLEAISQSYKNCYDMNIVIMRYSNVYGKYDFSDRLIPNAMRALLDNKDFEVYGEDKSLDFTYLDDAVDATISLLNNINALNYNVYNIGSGKSTSIFNVVDMIKQFIKSKSIIKITESHKGEVLKYTADISRLKFDVNYVPKIDIIRGLAKTVDYYQNYFNKEK